MCSGSRSITVYRLLGLRKLHEAIETSDCLEQAMAFQNGEMLSPSVQLNANFVTAL